MRIVIDETGVATRVHDDAGRDITNDLGLERVEVRVDAGEPAKAILYCTAPVVEVEVPADMVRGVDLFSYRRAKIGRAWPRHFSFNCGGGIRAGAPMPPESFGLHLPPIPEGYELKIVGSLATMSPIPVYYEEAER